MWRRQGQVGQAALGRLEPSPAAAEVDKHVELRERGRVGGLCKGDAARGDCGAGRGGGGGQAPGVSVLWLQAAAGRLAELGGEPGGRQLHLAALSVAARRVEEGGGGGEEPGAAAFPGVQQPNDRGGEGVGVISSMPGVFTSRKIWEGELSWETGRRMVTLAPWARE